MRKFIFIIAGLLTYIAAFAQLNIKSTETSEDTFYKDHWSQIIWDGNAFVFHSTDSKSGRSLTFILGSNKEKAIATLTDIQNWFDTAAKKSAITFEDNGRELTLYKQDNHQIVITTGDAVYAHKEFVRRAANSVVTSVGYMLQDSTPHFSLIKKDLFPKAIGKISELTEEKYNRIEK